MMTGAHYDYTALQKNIMYFIISSVQKHMTKDFPADPDLFGNLILNVDLKELVQNSNYSEVYKSVDGLMKKPLSYSYTLPNGNIMDVKTTMIYTMKHERGSRKMTLKISADSIPVLLFIGQGFTAYNKTIAISLPSVYAKRIYELCCRWRDKGYVRMKLLDFRRMLGIDVYSEDGKKIERQKFKQIKELRTEVLDKSQRLLQEQADYTFRYNLRKEHSRSYNVIEFWIASKAETKEKVTTQYQNVLVFLQRVFYDKRAFEATELIFSNGDLQKASERFERMDKDIKTKKIKEHGVKAYVTTVLIKEFNVPEKMVISEKSKKTKEAVRIASEILNTDDIKKLNDEQRAIMTRNTVNALFKEQRQQRTSKRKDVPSLANILEGL